jgi:hypothetical protein
MNNDYTGKDRRSQSNTAMRILINVQEQTHACVKSLTRDVSRNSALTISNGVKLDTSIKYNEECDKRLKTVELWKAGHEGEGKGRDKVTTSIGKKITLYSVIGTFIIAALALYFTEIKPKLDLSLGVYNKLTVIEQKYQELLKP